MKKLYTTILVLCISTGCLFAQSKSQISSLSTIAKTWGLLKYYHPEIATGKHNWDSTLIASVQRILKTEKEGQVVTELNQLLKIAGKDTARTYQQKITPRIAYKNYDISWINHSSVLNVEQKKALHYIVKHPYRGLNFYAQPSLNNDSTVSTPHEKLYQEMVYPDVNYRLLSLFRFWNVINYFYPYKYAVGKPWDAVLTAMIPVMIRATDTLSYHKALAKMAATINDSHGGLWPEVFISITGKYAPPFNFRLIDGKAVVTKIIDSARVNHSLIQVGSVINSINGIAIKRRIKEFWDYVPASNPGGKLKSMHAFILNTQSAGAIFSGENPDKKKFTTPINQMERNFLKDYISFFEMNSPVTAKVMNGNIGYVFFSNINRKNLDSAMQAIIHTKAIIFDMRNYPEHATGTYLLPGYLLNQPEIYARNTYPDFSLPGLFNYEIANEGTEFSTVGKYNTNPYQGKIILLVDSRTQSAAEWACMALMTAKNVTVIGNQTAGADGNVTRTVLPGGYKISFSGLGIYFPDGTETQKRGIPIDIKVKYTVQDFIRNHDPVLKRAIDFANRK